MRSGVLRSRGSMILFVDADGATRFSDFERLEEELLRLTTFENRLVEDRTKFNWSFPAVAIGSRYFLSSFFVTGCKNRICAISQILWHFILVLSFHFSYSCYLF